MPLPSTYASGTITVAANGTTVTGTGTNWLAGGIRAGDVLEARGLSVSIKSVEAAGALTLVKPWPGTALSASAYEIRYTPDANRVLAASRAALEAFEGADLRKNNLGAVRGPLPSDDISKGYAIGSRWMWGGQEWVATSVAVGAAEWRGAQDVGSTTIVPKTEAVTATYQRFISTKLGDVLSAQDFGVRPETASDQSAALNSAIGALLDVQASYSVDLKQVRHEIDLGPGAIRLENPLLAFPAGGRFRGRGASVTKLLGYGAFDLISTREFESDDSTRRYYNAMEIADFAVISSDPVNPLATALKLRGLTRNNAVRSVQVHGAVVSFDVDHSWTLVLDHCASMGSAATLHHVRIAANTGALTINGGRYDAARDHGIYVPVSSDQIELIIQNDAAVQFGNKAAVRVNGARTVKIIDSFFEGNCIGSTEDYHLDIRGTGTTLSSCEITGSVINNLAQANRDGLGVAYIDGFQSVDYDTANRWVRNGVRPYPAFGPNIMQADIALASSHTITAADLPFLAPDGNRRATIRQAARPVRVYGSDIAPGGTYNANGGAMAVGDVGGGQVMLGAHSGRPAIQGVGTGSGFDLDLNPHDGAVHHGRLVGRIVNSASNWIPSKTVSGASIDTSTGGRIVFLDQGTWAVGAEVFVWKPTGANNLIFRPASGVTINGAAGDATKTPPGLYRLKRISTSQWLMTHEPLA